MFHQYILNKWIDYETGKLRFFYNCQDKLRTDLYDGLMDAFTNSKNLGDIGKVFILPSSFSGGPRQMHELYQDSMAIVGHFGENFF